VKEEVLIAELDDESSLCGALIPEKR